MTIYIDIVFLENFIMNYIILFGTGITIRKKLKKIRLLLASFLGTLYTVIEYLGIIPIYSTFLMKLLLSILMIYVAFNPQSVKKMLKTLVLFYLVTFTTGGCAIGFVYLINKDNISTRNGIILVTNPFKLSIIAGIISFLIIQYSFYNNKRRLKSVDLICNINIKICGKLLRTKAFIDSGNSLKEPYTKAPVIVVEQKVIEKIVNLKDKEFWKLGGGDEELNIRWIPYKTIGKTKGMLMGIKAEYVEIEYEEDRIKVNDVIVGIYNKRINEKYSALVGLNLISGGKENEYNVNSKKNIFQCSKE